MKKLILIVVFISKSYAYWGETNTSISMRSWFSVTVEDLWLLDSINWVLVAKVDIPANKTIRPSATMILDILLFISPPTYLDVILLRSWYLYFSCNILCFSLYKYLSCKNNKMKTKHYYPIFILKLGFHSTIRYEDSLRLIFIPIIRKISIYIRNLSDFHQFPIFRHST